MKKNIIYIICIFFVSLHAYSQNDKLKGYRIEGDEVVFSFDKREYTKVHGDHGKNLDFADFDIENVVLSGEFNNWSMDQWKMIKIDENTYELRKKIQDFTDEFSWEFKYVINNEYWAEPYSKDLNAVQANNKQGHSLHVYNLNMFTAYADENGNASFKLKGYNNAKKVVLSGTFNRWNEEVFKMKKTKDGWSLTLQLKPDEYEYKFIIDGVWVEDIENPDKRKNEFEGFNSVINIRVPVIFKLNGYLNADKVVLSGSFIHWSEKKFPMQRTPTGWETTVFLSGGKHHYKYIVDNEWVIDPDNPVKEYDSEGNINSVCMVK